MRYTITNNSKAPRGVHTAAGRLVFIQPGESRTMDLARIEDIRRLPNISVSADKGGLPPPPADLVAAVAKATPKTDDIKTVRAEYEAKMGKRPFPGWDAAELRRRMAAA